MNNVMNIAFLWIEELKKKIENKEVSSKEIFDFFLKRIEKYDDTLECFNFINKEGFSQEWETKELAWIPLGIKDIFCEKNIPTTGSSKMLENFVPPYDASVIKKLKEAWMSSIGKLNMDEFAMGSSTETSAFKKTKNPWGKNRIPWGSSGGSAAAVAAWLVPAALWTDTGGSIRQPASLCWVVGFKPSYGRNSRFGVMPMASSLDCPWTFTRSVKDAALLYEIMNGEDSYENTTLAWKDTINPNIWESSDLKGKKIGIPKEYFEEGLDKNVRTVIEKAIEDLKNMGAEIKEVSLPMTKYALAAYYIIVPAEVSTNLARLDGVRYGHTSEEAYESLENFYRNNRTEGLGDEAKRRIILGSYVLSAGFYDAYFKKASQVRTLIIKDFESVFNEVDALICPTSPSVAWKIGEKSEDPIKMYLSDAYTIPASMAWLPWISLPCGFAESEDDEKEKLPVGLQILTPRLTEERLFEIASVYEKNTPWKDQMIPQNFI